MSEFTRVKADETWYTVENIDKAVKFNGGILDSYGYGYNCPESPDEGLSVGEYEIRLVDRRGMGNHGSFVAIAATKEAYNLQLQATLRGLRKTAEQAGCEVSSWSRPDTLELEPRLLPVALSKCRKEGSLFLGEDDLFRYFCHPHANHLRIGDARYRIWAKLK